MGGRKVTPGGKMPSPTEKATTGQSYLLRKNHLKMFTEPEASAACPKVGGDTTAPLWKRFSITSSTPPAAAATSLLKDSSSDHSMH